MRYPGSGGSGDVKKRRRYQRVPCGPGGVVADYVPFYFGYLSPMMYKISKEKIETRSGYYEGGDRPLVYLVTSLDSVSQADCSWVATDGNAASKMTQMTSDRKKLGTLIDWPLSTAQMWKDTAADPDRMRRRSAELLVHRRLPLSAVRGLVVRDERRWDQAELMIKNSLFPQLRVAVRPKWYYTLDEGGSK